MRYLNVVLCSKNCGRMLIFLMAIVSAAAWAKETVPNRGIEPGSVCAAVCVSPASSSVPAPRLDRLLTAVKELLCNLCQESVNLPGMGSRRLLNGPKAMWEGKEQTVKPRPIIYVGLNSGWGSITKTSLQEYKVASCSGEYKSLSPPTTKENGKLLEVELKGLELDHCYKVEMTLSDQQNPPLPLSVALKVVNSIPLELEKKIENFDSPSQAVGLIQQDLDRGSSPYAIEAYQRVVKDHQQTAEQVKMWIGGVLKGN